MWTISQTPATGPIALLEPAGTVVISSNGGFIRRQLADIAAPGWPGRAVTDIVAGTTTAPGLNDYIAANRPVWANDPVTFGLQIKRALGANERVQIASDDVRGMLTITMTGLLDDSVVAVRSTIRTTRGSDGLLRFVDGSYGQQCQPGRGHQDFTTEPCR